MMDDKLFLHPGDQNLSSFYPPDPPLTYTSDVTARGGHVGFRVDEEQMAKFLLEDSSTQRYLLGDQFTPAFYGEETVDKCYGEGGAGFGGASHDSLTTAMSTTQNLVTSSLSAVTAGEGRENTVLKERHFRAWEKRDHNPRLVQVSCFFTLLFYV